MNKAQVVALMKSSKSEQEWETNCEKVKQANNGRYPSFWFVAILLSGLADEIELSWSDKLPLCPWVVKLPSWRSDVNKPSE